MDGPVGWQQTVLLPGLPGSPHPDPHFLLCGVAATSPVQPTRSSFSGHPWTVSTCLGAQERDSHYLVGLYSWLRLQVTITMGTAWGPTPLA